MIATLFVGCGEKNADLENAAAYLVNMYQKGSKSEPMNLSVDQEVLSVVTVDGKTYEVEWSVKVKEGDKDSVKISESEKDNYVIIDIPDLPEEDILFTAIATVKEKKNTAEAKFEYKVAGINVEGSDDDANTDDATDGTASDNAGNTDTTSKPTNSGNTGNSGNSGNTGNSGNAGNTQLSLVTDTAKILKDAFALGRNETTPYIAQLTGKVVSIDREYNAQYSSISVTMTVEGKNIKCWNMKGTETSKVKIGDTITCRGVIKNFFYDDADTAGDVEFTWDDASQTEVALIKLVAGKVEEKVLSVVDTPVVGTAYKFGFFQTAKNCNYYAIGGMSGYYMATSTSSTVAIDVYLENANGGYYLYTMVEGKKQYMNMEISGTHKNAVYRDTASTVFTYNSSLKTLVTTLDGQECAFSTYGNYYTIGVNVTSKDGYFCHFYK